MHRFSHLADELILMDRCCTCTVTIPYVADPISVLGNY